MRIALAQRLAQRPVLLAQVADVQFLVDHHPHLAQRKRFQHIIAGSGLHGFHCGLHGAESRHHHHRQRRILPLDRLQELQTIHARQFQIGHHQIDGVLAQKLQPGLGVSGGKRGEAVLAEIQLEQAAHLGFVFDNQNCWHVLHTDSLRSKFSKMHLMLPAALSHSPEKILRSQPLYGRCRPCRSRRRMRAVMAINNPARRSTVPVPLPFSSWSQMD